MSGMVIDFPGGGARRNREDNRIEEEKAASKARRLATADEIRGNLERTLHVAEADREQMGRNLGRMWEGAHKKGHAGILSDLFKLAFDEPSGSVNYKKRKRFLLTSGEEPERAGRDGKAVFSAKGRDYLKLAEAIARLAAGRRGADVADEDRRRAVLQLVEGTSLGRYITPADKLRSEAVERIERECDAIAERIAGAVDLDWMREVLGYYDVSAVIDGEGEIRRLLPLKTRDEWWDLVTKKRDLFWHHLPEFHSRDELSPTLWEDFEAGHHIVMQSNDEPVYLRSSGMDIAEGNLFAEEHWSNFAPRVVLGYVLTPVQADSGRIEVSFDLAEMEAEVSLQEGAFGRALARLGEAGRGLAFDRATAARMYLRPVVAKGLAAHCGLTESPDDLYELGSVLEERDIAPWHDSEEGTIWFRRRLELKLGYDEILDRWRLCLALVHGVGLMHFGQEGVYGIPIRDGGFRPATNFGPQSDLLVHDPGASLMAVPRDNSTLRIFCVQDEDYPPCKCLDMGSGCLVLPSLKGCDALLTRIVDGKVDGHEVRLDLPFASSKPAPAPADTLAGCILRNLAYAVGEERLDQRLLTDARRKAELLKAHHAAMLAEYDAAIGRLGH